MGWNELKIENNSEVFKDVINKNHAYFIHSYEFIPKDKNVSITTDYGKTVTAAVSQENIFGSQFHQKKSKYWNKNINKFSQLIMKLFPAIDIKDKKCVRLVKGTLIIKQNIKHHQ